MGLQIGDTRAPYLDITPYDVNTVVSLTVVSPLGVETIQPLSGPVAQGGGTGRWSVVTSYTLTSAGPWYERWRATNAVTGIGAGTSDPVRLDVEATPPAAGLSGLTPWATVTDYANTIGGTLPTDLAIRLITATLQLRRETALDIYDPTAADTITALKNACCLQAKWAVDNGWDAGVPVTQRAVSIGSVNLGATGNSQAGGSGAVSPISPLALEVLSEAGLYSPVVAGSIGGWGWPWV